MSLHALLQENKAELLNNFPKILNIKILDFKTAITITLTIIGFILIRKNFVVGLKPRIIYETKKRKASNIWMGKPDEDVWAVTIRNVGLGAAVIENFTFSLFKEKKYEFDYQKINEELKRLNLRLEVDYYLANITRGYTLSAKEETCIFEIPLNKSDKVKYLDIKLKFKGLLGDRYNKEIYCIPRKGINYSVDLSLYN